MACQHNNVSRMMLVGGQVLDEWQCDVCKAKFYHLENLKSGPITVMEPYATLRDQFAMAALTGYLSKTDTDLAQPFESFAVAAYRQADAMMEARDKK